MRSTEHLFHNAKVYYGDHEIGFAESVRVHVHSVTGSEHLGCLLGLISLTDLLMDYYETHQN